MTGLGWDFSTKSLCPSWSPFLNALITASSNPSSISKKENELLEIKVKDKGLGIPLADQKHIVSHFFRAENVINIHGTGLGLVIVKQYLDLIKGQIDFESEENVGSTFRIVIPQ